LTLLYNTGARVSELTAIRRSDVCISRAVITLQGKGRKQRSLPLWKNTVSGLAKWLEEIGTNLEGPLFPNARGKPLSRSGVEYILSQAVERAAQTLPTLKNRSISPHTIRHTTAMHLLESGVDITVIALWLGHESPLTTHMYVEADLTMKKKAIEKLTPLGNIPSRSYRPSDKLLQFLESL